MPTWRALPGSMTCRFSSRLPQHSNVPRIDADQTIEAYNDLYGFQVGVDAALLRRGRFALNSDLKACLFDNEAGNRFGYESQRFGLHSHTGTSTSHVAFVGVEFRR
jgi:hypothetical protein